MAQADALKRGAITPSQHFTEPPPRYSEASLVKRLEELGIGRPSTYASIISVLQDRNYVRLESRRFVPEDRGRLVTAFLVVFFDRYVQPGFTAGLESQLDDVAAGARHWKEVLREFWDPFHGVVDEVTERRLAEVIDALDEFLGPHLFPPHEGGGDPRACPKCDDGRLSLKIGRHGPFIGCSNYPECRYTRDFGVQLQASAEGSDVPDRVLGVDPESDEEVRLRRGPYGLYVQRGEGKEAKRSSLPPNLGPDQLDLEIALALLALPREIGRHPETGQPIAASINRRGPYIRHEDRYVSLGPDDDVLSIGMNRAIALLAEAASKKGNRGNRTPPRELGPHPTDGKPVTVQRGRFGPFVKHGRTLASLRKGQEMDALSLEDAVPLLAEREQRSGKGKAKAGGNGASKAKGAAKSTANGAAKAKGAHSKAKGASKARSAKSPSSKRPPKAAS
jgi:DNA topoisomerase-1